MYVYNYKLQGQTMDSLLFFKHLGVYLSDDFRWNENVKSISKNAEKISGCPPTDGPNSGILLNYLIINAP